MRTKILSVAIIVFLVGIAFFIPSSGTATAPISGTLSAPSAWDVLSGSNYPVGGIPPTNPQDAKKVWTIDGGRPALFDWHGADTNLYLKTSRFTADCSTWSNPLYSPWHTSTGDPFHPFLFGPYWNSTITSIHVIAIWESLPHQDCVYPYSILSFSTDNGTTYPNSQYFNAGFEWATTNPSISFHVMDYNVTSLRTWNVTWLMTNRFWVSIECEPSYGATSYLDYLGISLVKWTGGGPPSNISTNNTGIWPPPLYTPIDFTSAMGFIGLLGLVAIIPVGIWFSRESGDRLKAFVGVIIIGAIFLALFMAGFG